MAKRLHPSYLRRQAAEIAAVAVPVDPIEDADLKWNAEFRLYFGDVPKWSEDPTYHLRGAR